MPIVHVQMGAAQAKDQNGKDVLLPPPLALALRGPVVQVTVTIEENAGKGLLAQGKSLPTPKAGLALIDTGATGTCIDDQAARDLSLPVIDVAKMTSATHQDQQCSVYPVQIHIPPALTFNCPRTIGAALAAQGLLILIWRDVLQQCNLFYNGLVGQFTLSL